MCAAISLSTGKQPKYVGKPFKETVDMVLTLTGSEREKISFVGDRLYTDIACANMADISAALVLSGESTREEMQNSQYLVEYVYPSVKEMYADWVYGQKKKCS